MREYEKLRRERAIALAAERTKVIESMMQERAPNGVTVAELCALFACKRSTIHKLLDALQSRGVCEKSLDTGPGLEWGHPGIRAHHAIRDAAKLSRRESAKRSRAAQAEAERQAAHDWKPERIFVPASEAPPLRPAGPRDVWSLA